MSDFVLRRQFLLLNASISTHGQSGTILARRAVGPMAQLVERQAYDPKVVGSNPTAALLRFAASAMTTLVRRVEGKKG